MYWHICFIWPCLDATGQLLLPHNDDIIPSVASSTSPDPIARLLVTDWFVSHPLVQVPTIVRSDASSVSCGLIDIGTCPPARQHAIMRENERLRKGYDTLVESLLSVSAADERYHWRYELVRAAFLFSQIRRDVIPPDNMVMYFVKGLTNDLEPLRRICASAVCVILRTFARPVVASKENVLERQAICAAVEAAMSCRPVVDKEWETTLFCDLPYGGWYGDRLTVTSYRLRADLVANQSAKLPASLLSHLEQVLSCELPRVLDLLADNHLSHDDHDVSFGAGEQLASLVRVKEHDGTTQFATASCSGFKTFHAQFFNTLFESIPSLLTVVPTHFVRLYDKTNEFPAQCTAVELLVGATRAWKHIRPSEAKPLQDALVPLLFERLSKCTPQMATVFDEGFSMLTHNMDPRRVLWLIDSLRMLLQSVAHSPVVEAIRLQLCEGVLRSIGWRLNEFGDSLLAVLANTLASPSLEVRRQMAWVLVSLNVTI